MDLSKNLNYFLTENSVHIQWDLNMGMFKNKIRPKGVSISEINTTDLCNAESQVY